MLAPIPARNVSLTDYFDEFVEASVASGHFQNASEVVREGLRLLERQRREDDLKLEALRQAIDVGRRDADGGRTVIVEEGRIGAYLRGLGRTGRA